MYQVFSKDECTQLISNQYEWELYNQDFIYLQTNIQNDWLNDRLKKFLSDNEKLTIDKIINSRIIKLSKGFSLPNHSFDYSNENSLLRDTMFTVVVFLNENFLGGEFYYNNVKKNIVTGHGIIHDTSTKQRISKVVEGDFYLLFSHFTEIIPNKLF